MILWLIGPSGAGKSTVGKLLAERRGFAFIDLDKEVEERAGRSIVDIFEKEGEAAFRRFEWQMLRRVIDRFDLVIRKTTVIATGGGVVLDPLNRDLMRSSGLRVFLDVPSEVALSRLGVHNDRPLLATEDPESVWRTLYENRLPYYLDSDLHVDASGDLFSTVEQIDEGAKGYNRSRWSFRVELGGEVSKIAAYRSPYALIRHLTRAAGRGRRCVITDTNVKKAYERTVARIAGSNGHVIAVKPGEKSKSLGVVEEIAGQLVERGFSRRDVIVGFGGGMVTDLAGFVASVFMRGMRLISVPTSLLAMVDASVGGKTAVNAAGMRNLLGTFRQPESVLICHSFLHTLPHRELRSGLVESVKMGIALDRPLERAAASATPDVVAGAIPQNIGDVIRKSVGVKLKVVIEDVREEKGRRAVLNFGHTFGHALEAAYPGLFTHGEAVAFGIVAAAEMAHGILDLYTLTDARYEGIIETILPLTPDLYRWRDELEYGRIVEKMKGDKKRGGMKTRFVIPVADGGMRTVGLTSVDEPKIVDAMGRAATTIINYHRSR